MSGTLISLPTFRPDLNPGERRQLRNLLAQDAIALASIFAITVLLAAATYFLFQSYTSHRKELADRWFGRGEKALGRDQPLAAINDFRSALLYAPGQRQTEVALASALASAGRIQEATAYFNTLWEAEPGNGEINVQLARLAARGGNEERAKHYYHAAIYGNWEGDGYLRRRDARLELVRYLTSRGRFDQARTELLLASGNAPASDLNVQGVIAGLMVEAHDPADALGLYQKLLTHAPGDLPALEGAARTAYALGNYALAYRYMLRAVSTPLADAPEHGPDEDLLRRLNRVLVLDPSANLPPALLAARVLSDREIARKRFEACAAAQAPAPAKTAKPSANTIALPPGLSGIGLLWAEEPKRLTAAALLADPQLEAREIQLIENTEKSTAAVCGAPSGDDAALLRLAQVPENAASNGSGGRE